jgi:hypothetical protein
MLCPPRHWLGYSDWMRMIGRRWLNDFIAACNNDEPNRCRDRQTLEPWGYQSDLNKVEPLRFSGLIELLLCDWRPAEPPIGLSEYRVAEVGSLGYEDRRV